MTDIITTLQSKSGRTITFRYPEISDVETITSFINKASTEKTFLVLQGEQFTIEQETQWLNGVIKDINDGKYIYIMAFDGDKMVGSTDIKMRSGIKGHVGVFGIIIDSEYRGDGIGELLTRTVIDEASKNLKDLKIVTLDVFAENERAINLYKKVGFIEYGILPKGMCRQGKFSDEIMMYLEIT